MSRASMAAAAASPCLDAPIYGIGTYSVGSSHRRLRASAGTSSTRDTDWAHSDAGRGRHRARATWCCSAAPNHEDPWACPIVRALRRIGAPYATSETYGWDSRRFAMYLRRLPVKAIIGIGGETVEPLCDSEGTLSTLLGGRRRRLGAAGRGLPPATPCGIEAATYAAARPGARARDAWRTRRAGERRRVGRRRDRWPDPRDEPAAACDELRRRGHRGLR